MVKIYALKDKGVIFYIGQSVNPEIRLIAHIGLSKNPRTEKDIIIKSIIDSNRTVEMEILFKCIKRNSKKKEREAIEYYINKGYSLVNHAYTVKYKISKKELIILQLMANDKVTKEIATIAELSERTIETIRQNMKHKAKVRSIGALMYYAYKNKLVV